MILGNGAGKQIYFREIYFYIICIAAIIIFIVGLIMTYDGTINYVRPTTYMTKPSVAGMYLQGNIEF